MKEKNSLIGSKEWIVHESKEKITLDQINWLAESVGWGNPFYPSLEKWKRVLHSSSHIAYIKDHDNLIAFGRILEDGMMCMFYDICVHPDYQGQGIGKKIMNHLIEKIKYQDYASIGLIVWKGNPTASEFYQKLGFRSIPAMELEK